MPLLRGWTHRVHCKIEVVNSRLSSKYKLLYTMLERLERTSVTCLVRYVNVSYVLDIYPTEMYQCG